MHQSHKTIRLSEVQIQLALLYFYLLIRGTLTLSLHPGLFLYPHTVLRGVNLSSPNFILTTLKFLSPVQKSLPISTPKHWTTYLITPLLQLRVISDPIRIVDLQPLPAPPSCCSSPFPISVNGTDIDPVAQAPKESVSLDSSPSRTLCPVIQEVPLAQPPKHISSPSLPPGVPYNPSGSRHTLLSLEQLYWPPNGFPASPLASL